MWPRTFESSFWNPLEGRLRAGLRVQSDGARGFSPCDLNNRIVYWCLTPLWRQIRLSCWCSQFQKSSPFCLLVQHGVGTSTRLLVVWPLTRSSFTILVQLTCQVSVLWVSVCKSDQSNEPRNLLDGLEILFQERAD